MTTTTKTTATAATTINVGRSRSGMGLFLAMLLCFLLPFGTHGWNGIMVDRRSYLDLFQSSLLLLLSPDVSTTTTTSSTENANTMAAPAPVPVAEITDKVFMDIRIARQDGSTYVRDDLPDTFENRVLRARLTIGLFGKVAPNHVEKFLSYIVPPNNNEDVDNPYPNYGRSNFPSLDQATGLLQGGNIPSLRVKEVNGATALTYGNRVFPAKLWIDNNQGSDKTTKLSHSTKGLLTHKILDVTPTFGITTRPAPELDATHTVFGQVLWDDDETTLNFFHDLEDLPTYAVDRPAGYDDFNTGGAATAVFNAQRDFFRGAAKSLGDTRVDKLYQGKLLRRVEVLQVGVL